MTHKCVNELTIIGSGNGLSPGRRQAIISTNAGILLIQPQETNFSEILFEIHIILFKKIHLKMSSGKWRPFWPGLNMSMTCRHDVWSSHFSCGVSINRIYFLNVGPSRVPYFVVKLQPKLLESICRHACNIMLSTIGQQRHLYVIATKNQGYLSQNIHH